MAKKKTVLWPCPICKVRLPLERFGYFMLKSTPDHRALAISTRACIYCLGAIARHLVRVMNDMERPN